MRPENRPENTRTKPRKYIARGRDEECACWWCGGPIYSGEWVHHWTDGGAVYCSIGCARTYKQRAELVADAAQAQDEISIEELEKAAER